ncbi:hypothetical protein X777_06509 [Ooceraea biroi]|uniref:Uncharacterized protein n=1 Tax=Ooceraea biroi TaxID=2015173 RepID=A0A026WBT2_OOCBI|nr:hypothetical protein X777_06509 [Ooceraea biroi]
MSSNGSTRTTKILTTRAKVILLVPAPIELCSPILKGPGTDRVAEARPYGAEGRRDRNNR